MQPAVRPPVHWKEMNNNLFTSVEPGAAEAAGWYIAHCDGGSRGNPGPSGYGAVIEDPQGRVAARLSKFLGVYTNNYAEYQGLLAVLAWALENGVRRLRVVSDSELMVRQMMGRYKVASPLLRPLWQDATRMAARLDGFEMRHTLRGGNQEADRLANEAMDRKMSRGVGEPAGAAGERGPKADNAAAAKPMPHVLNGIVKDGVVHLVEGALPNGTLVSVIRK